MRRRIETAIWRPGQKISTLIELEREFQVARVTIRQAIDVLRREGLMYAQQGRGTFIAEQPTSPHRFDLPTRWAALAEAVSDVAFKRIAVKDAPPLPPLLEGEGALAPAYVFMRNVYLDDGAPFAMANIHLADAVFRRAPEAFRQRPILSVLADRRDVSVDAAWQTLVIGTADLDTADLLRIGVGAPVAECRVVAVDDEGTAIYVADLSIRSDAIKLHIDLLTGRQGGPSGPVISG